MEMNIPWRYILVLIGFLGIANDSMLRINLNIAIVDMIKSKKTILLSSNSTFSEAEWYNTDMIKGSFYWGYLVTQIPGGILARKYGPKWVFGIGMLFNILMTFLSPLLAKLSQEGLIVARVIEGLAEGVTLPAVQVMLSNWAPIGERTIMTTIVLAGFAIGIIVGMPIAGVLADNFGWEWTFYGTGIIALIPFIGWTSLIYNSPSCHPFITQTEKEYILSNLEEVQEKKFIPWKSILTSYPVWVVIVVYALDNWGWYTVMTELPSYIDDVLGYDLTKNSLMTAMPYIGFIIFNYFSGFMADTAKRRKWASITVIRKVANTLASFIPGCALLGVAFAGTNQFVVFTCFVLSGLCNGAKFSGFYSTLTDIAPNHSGVLYGMGNTLGTIAGALSPVYTKALTPGTGLENADGWRTVFMTTAGGYFAACLIFLLFATGETQDWNFLSYHEKEGDQVKNSENSEKAFDNPSFVCTKL